MKKQFVVRIEAYEGDKSSISLTADDNYTLGEMYCVGQMSDDGIVDLLDNGYPSLGELYEAWPELKPKCPQCGSSKVAPTQGNGVRNTMDCLVCYTDFTPGKKRRADEQSRIGRSTP